MKGRIPISLILLTLFFTNCRKDIGLTPTPTAAPTPQPTPFVEYRDPFLGEYTGVMTTITQTVAYFSSGGYQIFDTITNLNITTQITKSTVTNTVILSTNPSGTFGVLSTGEYSYSAPPSLPHPYTPQLQNYKIRFRNDSVYIYTTKMYQPIYRQKDVYYRTTFNGKKQ